MIEWVRYNLYDNGCILFVCPYEKGNEFARVVGLDAERLVVKKKNYTICVRTASKC